MLTVAVAIVGPIVVVRLTHAARRVTAGDRLRGLTGGRRWRFPPRLRAWAIGALAEADLGLEPEAAFELWLGAIGATTLFAAGFARGLALPAALVTTAAGPIGLHIARGRAQRRFVAALPGGLEQIAAALRGGAPPAEAVRALAGRGGPLGADLRKVGARAALGMGLAEALETWPEERTVPSVRAAAGALALATTVGGRAADAIDGLAASLRERSGAVAEARSLSAQARLSAVVVGAGPAAYLAFSALVDPSSFGMLVSTSAGVVCLVLGLVLDGLGIVWMRRIVRDDDSV